MATIVWNDSLSVKIPSIDGQHMKLIDMINSFYENITNKSSKETLSGLIRSLKEYTVFHFSTEENYMKKYDFPGFKSHKTEHDQFVAKVLDYEERFKSGKLLLTIEITNFIKEWISNHIMHTDKKYSDFLIQKGIR